MDSPTWCFIMNKTDESFDLYSNNNNNNIINDYSKVSNGEAKAYLLLYNCRVNVPKPC